MVIPSSVACKGIKNIDWNKIANYIECTIPLPLVMQLDNIKLVNNEGKAQ